MKPLAFVLLVLVGSMILTNIPSQVYADPQLDSLLRIANQARDNIKIRLSQLPTIPTEIAILYEQGSAETKALAQSVVKEDISSSKQHFLSAMRLFKETSDKISSSAPPEPPLPPTDTSRLKNVIVTIEKAAERLKVVATKNNVNIDFTEFDKLMQTAKQNLEAGNADKVIRTLEIAKQFLLDVNNSLSTAAKQKTVERAKDFAVKQTERFDKLMAQVKELETKLDRLGRNAQDDDSKAKIAQAKDMLVSLKQLVSDGKFNDALPMIKSIEEIFNSINIRSNVVPNETPNVPQTSDDATKASASDSKLERIKTKIQTLEEQLNSLSEKAGDNDVANQWLKRAFSLIEKAKDQLDNSPEKAMRTLNEVDKIVHMIQRITQ